jgi:glycosyltransferase involved in cell wall biosynthesis
MLAILTTHPIQYQVPLWQTLARESSVPFEVWYLTDHGTRPSLDPEFGQTFAWDINTLVGYSYRYLDVHHNATPSNFWSCRLRERLRDRLRANNVKAVWIQGWQVAAYWQAVWEARISGVEVWLRAESNNLCPQPKLKRAIREVRNRWLFRRVDKFFYIGEANKQLYENLGVKPERLFPAPYAVDNERFAAQAMSLRPTRATLRKQWGIAEDAFCVLFCGKFIPKKRPLDLVAAAWMLLKSHQLQRLHLLFVGSGLLGCEIRRACRVVFDSEQFVQLEKNCPANSADRPVASFAGFLNQTEISQAYVVADCLVLPSDYGETWGLVVNEARASGLPCLVSRACGCAKDLSTDFTFDLGDVGMLALKLVTLAREPRDVIAGPPFSDTVSSVIRAYLECQDAMRLSKRLT